VWEIKYQQISVIVHKRNNPIAGYCNAEVETRQINFKGKFN
jgi:hypothetical protein